MSGVGHTRGMYYVYLLQDETKKLYVGYSENLKQRLREHIGGQVNTTKVYKAPRLVWYCAFENKKRALEFEKYLKVGSGHAFVRKHLVTY
jgi:predicted GIY-YIG superfamily endonuclease